MFSNNITSGCCKAIQEFFQSCVEPQGLSSHWKVWTETSLPFWIIAIVLFALFVISILKFKRIRFTGFTVFIIGFLLYFIGFDNGGTGHSFVALSIRSIISSLEMFVGKSDLLEVHHHWHESPLYMTLFALTHFCALSISFVALFKIFGQRIWYFIKLLYCSFKKNQNLNIFFGFNKNSKILARNIHNEPVDNKIIFVNLFRKTEMKVEKEASFLKLIDLFTFSNLMIEDVWNLGINSFFARSKMDLRDIDFAPLHGSGQKDSRLKLLKELELNNLRRWILRSRRVKIFFMSDDIEYNLLALDRFVMDSFFQEELDNEKKVIIYCLAPRNNVNLLREHQYLCYKNLEVHIIDSAYLSVRQLKLDYNNLPVNFVDIKNGAVTSKFTAMVVGFGETGQEALDFLYEYGAFAAPHTNNSEFKCFVVDERMPVIKTPYLEKRPGMKNDINGKLVFWPYSINDKKLWTGIRKRIDELNYVVISLGNDELNTSFAINLYEYAIRYRKGRDLSRFKIYVRAYISTNETRLNYIEQYLNKCNNPQSFASVFNVFGNSDKIYTVENVSAHDIDSKIMKNVRKYYDNYRNLSGDNKDWFERRTKVLNLKESYQSGKPYPDLIFHLREITRMEGQDFENYYHINTKIMLSGLPCNKAWNELSIPEQVHARILYDACLAYLEGEDELRKYSTEIQETVISLSATEHIRWNNSLVSKGYVYQAEPSDFNKELRDVRLTHNCLVPWNELNYSTKKYDAMVVATTLAIKFPELAQSTKS